jgi:hypothetical protein
LTEGSKGIAVENPFAVRKQPLETTGFIIGIFSYVLFV